jgi:thiamine biosynthesis lipoprotein
MTVAAAEWPAIGTTARLVVTSPDALDAACRIVADELSALDDACSRFRPDSEITALVQGGGGWQQVSVLLADVLACALDVARDTAGDVDPTMGADLSALGYDRDFCHVRAVEGSRTSPPKPLSLNSQSLNYRFGRGVSWRDVDLDRAGRRVRMPAGIVLDVGAVGKAWCADRCARRVATETNVGVLVSLGGDIATAGVGPAGGWLVTVQDTPTSDTGPRSSFRLRDGYAVATSSTVSRAWRRDGSQLHHILDPATRRPANPIWRTVTVAAATCVAANAASTAAVVRGRAAPRWLESLGLTARFVDIHGRLCTVGGWPSELAA